MEFRKVSLNNLGRLSEMFKLCLNKDVDENYFLWKYKDNPSGEVIAFEAVEGDTIAAFYGVIPEKYWVGDKEVVIFQSMDTMTHPDFQKRGLFVKLAQMTYDYLQEQYGPIYIVGIPGSNSFHGFVNKLSWKNTHNFNYIFLHRVLAKIGNIFLSDKHWQCSIADQGDEQLVAFLNGRKNNPLIRPKLSPAIFDWKVWHHPLKDFQVIKLSYKKQFSGYCICSQDEKGNVKIEMLDIIESMSKRTISNLCDFIFSIYPNAQFIFSWQPTSATLNKTYNKSLFLLNPFNKGPYSYRIPFITYSNSPMIYGRNWFDISSFDIQPLMQD